MTRELYRYSFPPHVPVEEIEATLLLALWGAESLHGETQLRLGATHFLDADRRTCVIDAGTPAGRDINHLFVGFLLREYGEAAFRIERLTNPPSPRPEEMMG